jgi:hypothetical protein
MTCTTKWITKKYNPPPTTSGTDINPYLTKHYGQLCFCCTFSEVRTHHTRTDHGEQHSNAAVIKGHLSNKQRQWRWSRLLKCARKSAFISGLLPSELRLLCCDYEHAVPIGMSHFIVISVSCRNFYFTALLAQRFRLCWNVPRDLVSRGDTLKSWEDQSSVLESDFYVRGLCSATHYRRRHSHTDDNVVETHRE